MRLENQVGLKVFLTIRVCLLLIKKASKLIEQILTFVLKNRVLNKNPEEFI